MGLEHESDEKLQLVLASPLIGPAGKARAQAEWDRRRGAERQAPAAPALVLPSATKSRRPAHVTGRMNQTEARYAREFLEPRKAAGVSRLYLFETIKVRLAKGTWYTPDFCEVLVTGGLWFHETKGAHMHDDALVKFKVAEENNPWAGWTLAQWKGGAWSVLHGYSLDAEWFVDQLAG